MLNKKIEILKNNSKFYKLDFGIDDENNLEKINLLIFFALLSGFSGIDISAKEEILNFAINSIKKAQ